MEKLSGLKKNDVVELDITGFSSEGSGVGHYKGQAVFVSGAAKGDLLECVIIKAKNKYAIGKIKNILKASPDRIVPDCEVFPRCGGCRYRHISYEAELKIKTQTVADAFKRIGHIDVMPDDAVGADKTDRYRNKAQYPVKTVDGKLLTGFYAPFTHNVVDCKSCKLHPIEFETILRTVSDWAEKYQISSYAEETGKGLLRHIYIRKAFGTGEIMVCLVINGDKIFNLRQLIGALISDAPSVKTLILSSNTERTNVIMGEKYETVYGKGYIEDILCGRRFRISPLSFYQINSVQAELLYKKAAEFAIGENTKNLLDLYCGAGTIGLSMSDKVEKLTGVDIVPEAIGDAEVNAQLNNVKNARFICSDAVAAAGRLKKEKIVPDTIILDPPRKGCDKALLGIVKEMGPERIVYISCFPATLARDCAVLSELGYKTLKAAPFDLFPRTAHVETVVLMSRVEK